MSMLIILPQRPVTQRGLFTCHHPHAPSPTPHSTLILFGSFSQSVCQPANPVPVMLIVSGQWGKARGKLGMPRVHRGVVSSARCEESMCALAQNGAQPRRASAAEQRVHAVFLLPPNALAKIQFTVYDILCTVTV